ncbi:MAG TPA: hypothetical protein VLF79_02075 [Candidatus Saccharimonadales bacterium]|nr:hypothetical protein [Candidatus Saccharimonadales bacterium]
MPNIIFTLTIVFGLVLVNEIWWRSRKVHNEFNRKFVHITVGSFVATWPFFLTWHQIQLLSIAFLVVVGISKYFNLFKAIHSVQRPTWGEIFFALAVGLVTLITKDQWIYTAAVLQMSLADGVAAIVGVQFGNSNRYLVYKQAKSIAGTLAFFAASFAILVAYNHYGSSPVSFAQISFISIIASGLENLGVLGLDNLLVPLVVAFMLANH